MQSRVISIAFGLSLSLGAAGASAEGYLDGSKPLICSIYQLFECDHPSACEAVTPDKINGFSHLQVDFEEKLITVAGLESPRQSQIEHLKTSIDGKLIIQGIEDGQEDERDGAGWSMSIMNPEGTMVLAVAGDGFGVMGLGACVPKP
jgi:hypothetical protein